MGEMLVHLHHCRSQGIRGSVWEQAGSDERSRGGKQTGETRGAQREREHWDKEEFPRAGSTAVSEREEY